VVCGAVCGDLRFSDLPLFGGHKNGEMKSGVLRDKKLHGVTSLVSWTITSLLVTLRAVSKLIGISHVGNFCF